MTALFQRIQFACLALVVATFTATSAAHAQVIHEQMTSDYKTMEKAIQSLDLKPGSLDKIGYAVTDSDVRVTAFRLQGVLRLLRNSDEFKKKQDEKIEKLYKDAKSIEDVIGKMDEATSVLKTAKKKLEEAVAKKEPKSKIDKLRAKVSELTQKADSQSKRVRSTLDNNGWLAKGAADESIDKLGFLEKWTGQDELTMITDVIRSEFKTFKKTIRDELIPGLEEADFGHESMEHNFHEFRRLARWSSIYIQSLPGIFSLSPYSTKGLSSQQVKILQDYKDYKYAQITYPNGKPAVGSPVEVDRYTFYLLSSYVKVGGDIKDTAEKHFKAIENGLDSQLDTEKFKRDMVTMMKQFLADDVLDALSESIKQ